MTRVGDPTLREALRLAQRGHRIAPGWAVIKDQLDGTPRCLCPAGRDCTRPGKHTWLARSWYLLASTDPTLIVPWFRLRPSSILMLTGGATRTIVIDVDGSDGEQSLAALIAELGELPVTLTQLTGRGWHLLLRVPLDHENDRIRNRVNVAPGIDLRAERGYIRVGGLHVSGENYRWVDPSTPIADLPAGWYARLVARGDRARAALQIAAIERPDDRDLPSVEERVDRARRYIERRPTAISGQHGHDALWTVTLDLVRRFVVPPEIALQMLDEEFSPQCQPSWSYDELAHKVESALEAQDVGWAELCGVVLNDEGGDDRARSGEYKGGEPGVDAAPSADQADPDRIVLGDDPDPVCYCSARIARIEQITDARLDVHLVIDDAPYARLPLLLPISTTERRSRLAHATNVSVGSIDDPQVVEGTRLRVEVIRLDGRLRIGRLYPPSGAR